MSDINYILKQFESTEANLKKLDELWYRLQNVIIKLSKDLRFSQKESALYENISRHFKELCQGMPKIDGYEIGYFIKPYSVILRGYIDISKSNDVAYQTNFDEQMFLQGKSLNEYRFKLRQKRRELARHKVFDICAEIEKDLDVLKTLEPTNENGKIEHPIWDKLQQRMDSIHALMGNPRNLPPRWGDMMRHISYGEINDANDIIQSDWPSVRNGLDDALRRKYDPIPVSAEDIGTLVSKKPSGNVVTELQWKSLSPDEFERLIFNLVSNAPGYEAPQWLTHTNAPDKGRDLSVYRVIKDALTEPIRQRVIIACKHYTSRSINITEVSTLVSQAELWRDPPCNVVVIATSGRFTTDAIEKIEKDNTHSNNSFRIEMWPDTTLERLLIERPELIAEFNLR